MKNPESNLEPKFTRRELLLSGGLVFTAVLVFWKNYSDGVNAQLTDIKNTTHSVELDSTGASVSKKHP